MLGLGERHHRHRRSAGHAVEGAADVFVLNGTTWTSQVELSANDGVSGDGFGTSVALDGITAVVGAPGFASGQGAAYVFTQSGTTWDQQPDLLASDAAPGDAFGVSVAVSGGTVLVGADQHASGRGAAYVFVQSGTSWSQQAELAAGDGGTDSFGLSVAVNGVNAVVGGSTGNSTTGVAFLFAQSGTSWSQPSLVTAGDGATADAFGRAVTINGGVALVGAPDHAVDGNAAEGAAYVFAPPCFVSGVACNSGDPNPANACQHCNPGVSTTAWSADPDGTSCASGMVCASGTCTANCFIGSMLETPGQVDSANACPECTPATSTTAWSNEPDGTTCDNGGGCVSGPCNCLIGGELYPSGTKNSSNPCQSCVPTASATSWTTAATGTSCGAGELCNGNACIVGGCRRRTEVRA